MSGGNFRRIRRIHLIGIGGAGMCGIAEVLLNQGYAVSGSDLTSSSVTTRLEHLGAEIHYSHEALHVQGSDVVVYSSAVRPENVEMRAARDLHIPTIPRSEMLAELMRSKTGIAISGTHGKTTTTSMVGAVLQEAGFSPTLIVGGIVRALDTGIRMGDSPFIVVEADEFDRSFLKLAPTIAVITTLEAEHLDTYGDLEGVKDAFVEFANKVPFYGSVIVCSDHEHVLSVIPRIKRPVVSYGFNHSASVRAQNVTQDGTRTRFSVSAPGKMTDPFELQVPGRHNVMNALAAISVADELEIPRTATIRALHEFSGVRRRFEVKGTFKDAVVIDDYAHHPTEVRSVLKTARECWPNRKIIALFQPHLFTRTRDFSDEFGKSLALADIGLVTEIYGSRETPIAGVTSNLIVEAGRAAGMKQVESVAFDQAVSRIDRIADMESVIIVMGAGSITRIADELTRQT